MVLMAAVFRTSHIPCSPHRTWTLDHLAARPAPSGIKSIEKKVLSYGFCNWGVSLFEICMKLFSATYFSPILTFFSISSRGYYPALFFILMWSLSPSSSTSLPSYKEFTCNTYIKAGRIGYSRTDGRPGQ